VKTQHFNEDYQSLDLTQNGRTHAARLIAYYLPQYHPIPENDAWWGNGFTEWTNVTKAKPLFRGHRQPRLPTDLGFYDLRLPESREAQAEEARNCGVEGFCYWHYWFGNGRRILERPFEEVLSSGKPDFPFCLSWANSSWSGIWHGNPKSTLIEQIYPGRDDEKAHFEYLRKQGNRIRKFLARVSDLDSTASFEMMLVGGIGWRVFTPVFRDLTILVRAMPAGTIFMNCC
jgi:lipopolysaccharide biosynthesis protein